MLKEINIEETIVETAGVEKTQQTAVFTFDNPDEAQKLYNTFITLNIPTTLNKDKKKNEIEVSAYAVIAK